MRVSKNVENWERVASVALGAGLIAMAVRRRQSVGQLSGTGLALIARGSTGYCPVNAATGRHRRRDDTRDALGGPRGLVLELRREHGHRRGAERLLGDQRGGRALFDEPAERRHVVAQLGLDALASE